MGQSQATGQRRHGVVVGDFHAPALAALRSFAPSHGQSLGIEVYAAAGLAAQLVARQVVGQQRGGGVFRAEHSGIAAVEQVRQMFQIKGHGHAHLEQRFDRALVEIGFVFARAVDQKMLAVLQDFCHHRTHAGHDVQAQLASAVAPEQGRDPTGVALGAETQAHLQAVGRERRGVARARELLPAVFQAGLCFRAQIGGGRLLGAGAGQKETTEKGEFFHSVERRWRNASALAGLRSRAFW